jgi:hypothetical protein
MKKALLLFVLLSASIHLYSLQWPVQADFLESSFLEEYNGEVFPGLIFRGYDSMRPFDYGETIFRFSPEDYSPLPSMDGSMLVLEHENGFQSIYTHISSKETRADRNRLSAGEYLKSPGGGKYPGICHFYIRDALQNQLVNPLILLPLIKDSNPPVIESILLADSENEYELNNDLILPVGHYDVYVKGLDNNKAGKTKSPFGFTLYNLGTLQLERALDSVNQKDNELAFDDGVEVSSVFLKPGYLYLGGITLTSGQAKLEIFLSDVQGNELSRAYSLEVVR